MFNPIRKISKLLRLIRTINVSQTLRLYFTQPHDKNSVVHICNKSLISIDKTAQLKICKEGGGLEFNKMEDPFKRVRPSKLIMKKGSSLCIKGYVQMFEGVKIELQDNAILEIGDKTYINHDSFIRSRNRISIGNNCAIAYSVLIQDSDYHLIYDNNGKPKRETVPVIIDDNVWIGAHAIILKGVHIGEGAIVGAGSVVSRDVPKDSLVIGNPARIVRTNVKHG